MRNRGFTMIELLVVIAILAVMMVMGLGSYSRSLSRGRDTKRMEDMKMIQKGFEMYFSLNNQYDACSTMEDEPDAFSHGFPQAPGVLGGYDYTCNSNSYCVCAELENGEDYGNSTVNDCTNFESVSSETTNFYCVENLQ